MLITQPRRAGAALLTACLLAGCGTTTSPSALGQLTDEGLAPVGSSTTAATAAPGTTGSQTATPGASVAGPLPGLVTSPGTTGPTTTPSLGAAVRADRTPVEIGVNYPSAQAATGLASIGFDVNGGDPKSMAIAMAGWVNAHGGLAGHPVRLVFHEQSVTASKADDDQAACALFTQDHKAIAAVDPTAPSPGLGACLARRGAVLSGGGAAVFSEADLRTAKTMWGPYLLSGERMVRQLVARTDAMGWFVKGDKVGVLYADASPYNSLKDLARRELQARGIAVAAEAGYAAGDPSQMSAQMSGLALKFKAAGVKRIVVVDCCAQVLLLFTTAARSQGYHPMYTITSADVPNTVESLVSPSDLAGAVGIGWAPAIDVAPARAPRPNSASALCTSIYKAAKVDTSGALAGGFAAGYCDGFLFLHDVYARAGSTSLPAWRSTVDRLGGSYVSPVTFTTWFGPGRFDGVQQTRDLRYDTGCSCFRYSSPLTGVS